MNTEPYVIKILTTQEYQLFEETGVFSGSAIDLEDGFIHFSSADQVQETADKHFGQYDEIWMIRINVKRFGEKLKWEPSRGGELFPHLYEMDLKSEDVDSARRISQADGHFRF